MRWFLGICLAAALACAGCGGEDADDLGPDGSTDTDTDTDSDSDTDVDTDSDSDTDVDTCPEEEIWNGDYLIDGTDDIAAISGTTEINGALSIAFPDEGDTPLDLAGLECLRSVGGDVEITSTYLTSLSGLENLTEVGGMFRVADCAALADLGGLSGLTDLNELIITGCGALQDLSGLENLVTVSYLALEADGAMTSLAGLDSLDEPECDVHIADMDALVDLHGLEGCGSSACLLEIGNNDSLVDLSGLEWAAEISCYLTIGGNPNMESLAGLDDLALVGRSLEIWENPALTSLGALDGLAMGDATPDGCACGMADSIRINGNSSLPTCDAMAFVADMVDGGFTGSTTVNGNQADACSDWCPGYAGADPCCLESDPCDLHNDDVCDCDEACSWDDDDCNPWG
jgi:hypothetical protein